MGGRYNKDLLGQEEELGTPDAMIWELSLSFTFKLLKQHLLVDVLLSGKILVG